MKIKPLQLHKDKRGNFIAILFFFTVVAVLLVASLFLAFGGAAIDLVMDEVTPEISGIGEVGVANVSEYADYSIVPFNSFVQNLTWMTGVVYVLALIMLFGISIMYRATTHRVFIPIFIVMAILIILLSILISNIYEDFYKDNGDFGDRLKEQVLLSWLIINSPAVFIVMIFLSGIILFTGMGEGDIV